MKWYERQKQLYAQKNQPEAPAQPEQAAAPRYEEPQAQQYEEPMTQYEDIVQPEEQYEQPVDQEGYDSSYDNAQYDEMLHEDPAYQTSDELAQNEYEQQVYDQEEPYTEPMFANSGMPTNAAYETTTISKGSILTGNIETDGDLIIRGHVKGDIICNANLSVFGVVEGIINCNNAYLEDAIVVGDIGCSGNLQITQSSTVDGNIEAYELLNGGHIKGNAVVAEGIRFSSTSVIVGDISANDLQVDRGAVIQGNVVIRQEIYFNGQ